MTHNLIDPDLILPGSEELPCSDDTPVDNENQNTLPNWLLATLEQIWHERQDWYFGVDMGIYNREAQRRRAPWVIPDGFLSLGVQRHKRNGFGRLSYVLQEENEIVPIMALEMVSQTYGQEYGDKLADYVVLGVQYYVIYNPEYSQRHQHQPFEVYKLGRQGYQLQHDEPFWMPEVGLGIGRVRGQLGGIEREWLAWHNEAGVPYPLPLQALQQAQAQVQQAQAQAQQAQAQAQQAQERLVQEQQQRLQLLEKLQKMGIDPDEL